jgi:hypothetical protein
MTLMADLSDRPKRKVLYSPRFGAGWTTWESDAAVKKLMLTYRPIIEALERGESLATDWKISHDLYSEDDKKREAAETKLHPAVRQLITDVRTLGKEPPYLGGLRDICVREVSGRVRIEEYDGSESVEEEGEYSEWL